MMHHAQHVSCNIFTSYDHVSSPSGTMYTKPHRLTWRRAATSTHAYATRCAKRSRHKLADRGHTHGCGTHTRPAELKTTHTHQLCAQCCSSNNSSERPPPPDDLCTSTCVSLAPLPAALKCGGPRYGGWCGGSGGGGEHRGSTPKLHAPSTRATHTSEHKSAPLVPRRSSPIVGPVNSPDGTH